MDIRVSHGQASLGTRVAYVFDLTPLFFWAILWIITWILMEINGVKKILNFVMFHIISPRLPCAKQT